MAFKGQFTYGIPVTAINIVDALPDNAVIPATVVGSRKGSVLGVALGDLKSQLGSTHYVGEEFGGGVVFYVYRDSLGEEHGLICSIVDQAFDASYSNVDNILIGTTTYWDGQTNTNLMLSQGGASTGAWKDCTDYSYGGFTDWYLPSIDELSLLRTNTFNSNKTLSTIVGAQLLSRQYYWSSTEESSNTAWTYNFLTGETAPINKFYSFWVRAIRQF
jgi:hypothetical protein